MAFVVSMAVWWDLAGCFSFQLKELLASKPNEKKRNTFVFLEKGEKVRRRRGFLADADISRGLAIDGGLGYHWGLLMDRLLLGERLLSLIRSLVVLRRNLVIVLLHHRLGEIKPRDLRVRESIGEGLVLLTHE